jgi:hypothetical protein
MKLSEGAIDRSAEVGSTNNNAALAISAEMSREARFIFVLLVGWLEKALVPELLAPFGDR